MDTVKEITIIETTLTRRGSGKHKSLGQIAYEVSPEGGQQNWGRWENSPQVVRRVHEDIARAIERTVKRRLLKKGWRKPVSSKRTNSTLKIPPVSPGKILVEEFLKPMKLSRHDFSEASGIGPACLRDIITGKQPITRTIARCLSLCVSTTPKFWLNLQRNYDKRKNISVSSVEKNS